MTQIPAKDIPDKDIAVRHQPLVEIAPLVDIERVPGMVIPTGPTYERHDTP